MPIKGLLNIGYLVRHQDVYVSTRIIMLHYTFIQSLYVWPIAHYTSLNIDSVGYTIHPANGPMKLQHLP